MSSAILFTHSVLNFSYLSLVQYKSFNSLKFYHGILKFQLDHKEQKMAMLSRIYR